MNKALLPALTAALLLAGGLTALTLATGVAPAPAIVLPAADGAFAIDPVHSSVVFRIKHMSVANFYGRFNKVSGSFDLTNSDPAKNSVDVTIDADSVDTRVDARNNHIKTGFINAKEFPTMTFKGTAFKKTGDKTWDITGDLTFHGVTKSLTVSAEETGTGTIKGTPVAGAECKFSFKRSDYGSTLMLDALSDNVDMIISLEGGKK